jgi:hypothetical protein
MMQLAAAPAGMQNALEHMMTSPWKIILSTDAADHSSLKRAAIAASAAIAIAAGALLVKTPDGTPGVPNRPTSESGGYSKGGRQPDLQGEDLPDFGGGEVYESDEEDYENDYEPGDEDEDGTTGASSSANLKRPVAKLWSKDQFPEGVGATNCDLRNLHAAQQWACPCKDR